VLTYTVNAQVGGKIAQLGSRLIDSTAKKLADQFFSCFAAKAGAPVGLVATSRPDILPGQPVPPGAAGVPIVEGQAAGLESVPPAEAPRLDVQPLHHGTSAGVVPPARTASVSPGHLIEDAAHEVEEEVEAKAAIGFLGGPIVWALLLMLALLFVYVIAS
jgi:hypothetical protein